MKNAICALFILLVGTALLGSPAMAQAIVGNTYTFGAPYFGVDQTDGVTYPSVDQAVPVEWQAYVENYDPQPGCNYQVIQSTPTLANGGLAATLKLTNPDICFPDSTDHSVDPVPYVLATATVVTPDASLGQPTDACSCAGDPVVLSTGNKLERVSDGQWGPWLKLDRYYNSVPGSLVNLAQPNGAWTSTYQGLVLYISASQSGNNVPYFIYYRNDGRMVKYYQDGSMWGAGPSIHDTLTVTNDGAGNPAQVQIHRADTLETETYQVQSGYGQLTSITDSNGMTVTLTYEAGGEPSATNPDAGHLVKVTDPRGRSLIFKWVYNPDLDKSFLAEVDVPSGKIKYSYTFNLNAQLGYLSQVTYGDNSNVQYLWNEPNDVPSGGAGPAALTGVIDEAGVRYETTTYGPNGQALSTGHPGGADAISIIYNADGSADVTEPTGNTVDYGFAVANNGTAKVSSRSGYCETCGGLAASVTYDASLNPQTTTDFNGNVTGTIYDGNGLLTQKVESEGQPSQRTTTISWDVPLRKPLLRTVSDASGSVVSQVGWAYNDRGEPLARCEVDPGNSADVGYVCSNTDTAPEGVRRWTYTYCDAIDSTQCPIVGLLLTSTGPRTDLTQTTSYSYYMDSATGDCTTPGGACHQPGDLYQVTDPLGHVTTYASYDADGRVTRITDANGVNTDFTYTPRGWLTSRSVAGATKTFDYTPYGAVQSITDPDGVVTTFTYDAAHRLTDITDAQGNDTHYTLDAAGNKTKEEIFDSAGKTHYVESKTFNTLGQLTTIVDGLNHTVFNANTSGDYDANGNLVHSNDALGVQTQRSYDALNRLVSTIRDYNGTDASTKNSTNTVAYDALDRVTGVSDPDSLVTSYTYDGLGDLTHLQSPDTGLSGGSSGDVFDAAGNLTQHTDARGVVTKYAYDGLNRLTAKTYPAHPTLNVSYTYDQTAPIAGCSTNGNIGHLTTMTDASGSTSWCYTAQGDIGQVRQNINGVSYLQSFTYTPGRRLQTQQYPSGFTLSYSYDSDGRVATVGYYQQPGPYGSYTDSTVTPLITAVSYLPFGPMSGYSWAQGSQYFQRAYDLNYALTDIIGSALNLHFLRDAKGRMAAEGDTVGASPANESYQSDALDRLTQLTDANGATEQAFSYNLTGDRLSKTVADQATSNYGYQSGTHQLTLVGNAPRTVDADGNTTSMLTPNGAQVQLVYDDRNLLTQVLSGGNPIANYQYNGQGIRVWRTITAPSTGRAATVYDPLGTGNLYGEYFAADYREYVYLNGIPVASAMDAGLQTPGISYLHADGLGSVRVATTTAGAVTDQWPWLNNAFGDKAMTGASGYYLRFPGQYYDVETGLHYNGHRYYDPSVGRYIQSDPTGLAGSINTYAYVGGSPFGYSDPQGLQATIAVPGSTVDMNTAMSLGSYAYATQGNPFATSGASLPDPTIERNMSLAAYAYMSFYGGVMGGELLGTLACPEATLAAEETARSPLQALRLSEQLSAEEAAGARAPTRIESWSDHILEQIISRDGGIGVQKSALEDAFESPNAIQYAPSKYGPTFQYVGQDATVVVNSEGNAVTGWATNSAGTGP